ncbi:hypothetical protein TPY_1983 [Sulfobacillus acidophilus TPY]|nr:hypothetical protein TPY_1983 [Sulfobacillus acidophilus TPY]
MKPLSYLPPRNSRPIGRIVRAEIGADQLSVNLSSDTDTLSVTIYNTRIVRIQWHNGPDIFHQVVQPLLDPQLTPETLQLKTVSDGFVITGGVATITVLSDGSVRITAPDASADLGGWGASGTARFVQMLLAPSERVFGLGEKTGGLDKRGRRWTQWTTDVHPHTPDTDEMYQAVPMMLMARPGGGSGTVFGEYVPHLFRSDVPRNRNDRRRRRTFGDLLLFRSDGSRRIRPAYTRHRAAYLAPPMGIGFSAKSV